MTAGVRRSSLRPWKNAMVLLAAAIGMQVSLLGTLLWYRAATAMHAASDRYYEQCVLLNSPVSHCTSLLSQVNSASAFAALPLIAVASGGAISISATVLAWKRRMSGIRHR